MSTFWLSRNVRVWAFRIPFDGSSPPRSLTPRQGRQKLRGHRPKGVLWRQLPAFLACNNLRPWDSRAIGPMGRGRNPWSSSFPARLGVPQHLQCVAETLVLDNHSLIDDSRVYSS